ncbi:unnamed protein product [Gordionus sp. m RMFG-2023]|uniref:small ribosomal subunit protein uS9m-like n=1 Tax=Gordionus sp. m RMFG-2023 TaxID=3053472 RepID=UPI0030E41FF4
MILRRFIFKNIQSFRCISKNLDTQANELDIDIHEIETVKRLNRAMKYFFKKSQELENQMKSKTAEFEIGKRHLANMMSLDPESLNQKSIDEAIEYLMPSGLFSIKSRPKMKPPEEIYPKQKELQFDQEGRPFNAFYYTGKPNYYCLIYEIAEHIEKLNEIQYKMEKKYKGKNEENELIKKKLDITGTKILSKEALEKKLLETISSTQYTHFMNNFERLCNHPYANELKDFIITNTEKLDKSNILLDIPPILKDEHGNLYSQAYGKRKTTWAHAKLTQIDKLEDELINLQLPLISINKDKDITYFPDLIHRGHLLLPLTFWGHSSYLDTFKIDLRIQEDAKKVKDWSCKAGACRLAIARAITSFLNPNQIEKMRLAGLLSYDPRTKERKKPGQKGARAKFTWRKR